MCLASLRFWLLDVFGRIVTHDSLRDCLAATPFFPERYPGLFFFADDVSPEHFPVILRKVVSLPMPIPPLQAHRQLDGTITLQRTDGTMRYMRSIENDRIDFTAQEARDWEHFLMVSEEMLRAFAILSQPEVSTILSAESGVQPPLTLVADHKAKIGEVSFPLVKNRDVFERIGALIEDEALAVDLIDDANQTHAYRIKRS